MRQVKHKPKPNSLFNNDDHLDSVIENYKRKEKPLFPLRINRQTVIYVTKDKCNEEYRQDYLKRMNKI